ncbi:MAG: iron ABC transporter permease, partial [Gammaproteobacteria bacterium]|nr:iron ABC transporter permease [Gammaproteobacteria bacterium]
VTMCRFPGRQVFEWALLTPLAMPAYVVAYVYTDLLEYAGPVQAGLRALLGYASPSDYWFPQIRTLGGAFCMLTLVLYPYVYLLSRAAFLEQSNEALEAGRSLGRGPFQVFLSVSLPIAQPAIAVGVALVLMETLNDFGTVDFFGVPTLALGLYDVWLNMGNLAGGAQIALVMLGLVLGLVWIERRSRGQRRNFSVRGRKKALRGFRLVGWKAGAASVFCAALVLFGFVVPASVLGIYALENFQASFDAEFQRYAWNSVRLALAAATFSVLVGLALAYGKRYSRVPLTGLAVRIASLGYALPGPVLALGVIVPFAALDNLLDAAARNAFGLSTGLLLSGTLFALLFAYVVRFMPIAFGAVESSLEKVSPAMEMASRSLGCTPLQGYRRVHVPLVRSGAIAGATVVFVDVMKELPATLILRPFNFETLATNVYQFASDQQIERAALGALFIVLSGLVPVVLLSRALSSSRTLET